MHVLIDNEAQGCTVASKMYCNFDVITRIQPGIKSKAEIGRSPGLVVM